MEIRISLAMQQMALYDDDTLIRRYAISTAALGAGEQTGSYQTPRGRHIIRAKIGAGLPCGAVFKARRPTGEIWTPALHAQQPGRDWILSRILWLSGCEVGCNRLGQVDTMRRYIYIHGTPDGEVMGVAASHGCIRMRNHEVIELFGLVPVRTTVVIEA
ncbi:MAG: ErfK/YbiS/YcfS/YnhG [Proteobacteria bacterium]|nr:ErfK/YbiS/YcfS/YnhG [Pseudomonadota bacterium]